MVGVSVLTCCVGGSRLWSATILATVPFLVVAVFVRSWIRQSLATLWHRAEEPAPSRTSSRFAVDGMAEKEKVICVHVCDTEGAEVAEVDAPSRSTVRSLKVAISEQCSVPPVCQQLSSQSGVVLEDGALMDLVYLQCRGFGSEMTVVMVKRFESINELLAQESVELRQLAAVAVGQLTTEEDYEFTLGVLKMCLRDGDTDVRRAAVDSLVRTAAALERTIATMDEDVGTLKGHSQNALNLLSNGIADYHHDVRQDAGHAMNVVAKGEKLALKAVKSHLKHYNKGVRQVAVRVLSSLAAKGDKETITALCASLEDAASEVRCEVAKALRLVGSNNEVVKHLQKISGSTSGEVRRLAVETLRVVSPPEDEEAIAAVIACMRDPLVEIRLSAMQVLPSVAPAFHEAAVIALCGQLGEYRAPKPPPKTGDTSSSSSEEEDDNDAEGDDDEGSTKSDESDGGNQRRKRKKKPEPEPIVIPLEDEDPQVRKAAVMALAELAESDDEQTIAILLMRFEDTAPEVRRAAADALLQKFAKKDDERVVPAMISLTLHEFADVRWLAVKLLAELVVQKIDKTPTFEDPPSSPVTDELEAAKQYVSEHDMMIERVQSKIEEVRKKAKSEKSKKMKRMFKATLLKLERDEKYADAIVLVKEWKFQVAKAVVESQRQTIADTTLQMKKSNKKSVKKELFGRIKALEADEAYLEALILYREVTGEVAEEPGLGVSAPKDEEPEFAEPVQEEIEEEVEVTDDEENEGLEDEEVVPMYLEGHEKPGEVAEAALPQPRPSGPVTALACLLNDEYEGWEVRLAAAGALKKLADHGREDVIQAAKPLLLHPVAELRVAAIELLASKTNRSDKETNDALTKLLKDRQATVRAVALKALDARQ
eukprot:TRINITY_DN24812_c0_g1_i1.p1 TRINITY_DN24812_c0_g1~~TRINITY_DN24812_c0_g1_i1.p1  ORF type:complete len:882 (-),score=183.36 TRINITY_DN24812_c0_g1_i1:159-2804(-)